MLFLLAFANVVALSAFEPQEAHWSLQPTLAIGSLDRENYTLTRVEGITTDDHGHVFVLQHEDAVIKEYDEQGVFIRRIGRRGAGPGEFLMPVQIWWYRGSLWALDSENSRVSQFDGSGRFQKADAVPPTFRYLDRLSDGSLLGVRRFLPLEMQRTGARLPLLRVKPGFLRADTIGSLDLTNSIVFLSFEQFKRRITGRNPVSDADLVRAAHAGDQILIVRRKNGGSRPFLGLVWLTPQGDSLRAKRLAVGAPRSARMIRDSIVDSFARSVVTAGVAANLEAARRLVTSQFHIPETLPPAVDVLVAANGSLWIQRGNSASGSEWVIADSLATPIATLTAPRGFRIMHVVDDHVWGVRYDEFEVPSVVRMRIVRRGK